MITRNKEKEINEYIRYFPVVGIVGPRQCGKSTVAHHIANKVKNTIYLDLESPSDRARLSDPVLFFSEHKESLICLDEIQFMPELFQVMRGVVDQNKKNGQFLL